MEMVARMRDGLLRTMKSTKHVLASAQDVCDACGEAIALWFGNLSGPALEAAINEAFSRFDADSSGQIDRDEFEKAMRSLGLRLEAEEYDVLFKKVNLALPSALLQRSSGLNVFMWVLSCTMCRSILMAAVELIVLSSPT
jgi:hypothetical protein